MVLSACGVAGWLGVGERRPLVQCKGAWYPGRHYSFEARRTTGEGYLKNLREPLNFGGLVSGHRFCVLTKP